MSPSIALHNRQRGTKIDIAALQAFAERALELVLKLHAAKVRPKKLSHITVILISDSRMSDLHRRFLQQDGPTDVITFQHGEIFISVETARRAARAYRTSLEEEIHLYLVHGLLHLRGFDDKNPSNAKTMRATQVRIARRAMLLKRRSRTRGPTKSAPGTSAATTPFRRR